MQSTPNQPAGRTAEHPHEIPKRGWRDVLKRTLKGLSRDNASIIAAGVAFYAFLSVPAILTALVSIYGLVASPSQIGQQMSSLQGIVPGAALGILSGQLSRISSQAGGTLTFALVASIVFALWSGSNSVKALITALNVANGEQEKRGFFKLTAIALGLTLGALVGVAVTIALIAGVTAVIDRLPLPGGLKTLIEIARWPLLAVLGILGLAVAYRYCPSRQEPKWRWVSWGAVAAMVLWVVVSALFSWYVGSFGNYDKTYGSLSAIVALLMWFYLSAYVVLLGAKLNAEIEHQTGKDTTTGQPKPMGERGARMADSLGGAA
jgi:membrane protein